MACGATAPHRAATSNRIDAEVAIALHDRVLHIFAEGEVAPRKAASHVQAEVVIRLQGQHSRAVGRHELLSPRQLLTLHEEGSEVDYWRASTRHASAAIRCLARIGLDARLRRVLSSGAFRPGHAGQTGVDTRPAGVGRSGDERDADRRATVAPRAAAACAALTALSTRAARAGNLRRTNEALLNVCVVACPRAGTGSTWPADAALAAEAATATGTRNHAVLTGNASHGRVGQH